LPSEGANQTKDNRVRLSQLSKVRFANATTIYVHKCTWRLVDIVVFLLLLIIVAIFASFLVILFVLAGIPIRTIF
jgi:hypothetical protein